MPNKLVTELKDELKQLKEAFQKHLEESGYIKTDLMWLKWINTGIAALVFFKVLADYLKQ